MRFLKYLRGERQSRILCHFNHYFGKTSAFVGKSTAGDEPSRTAVVRTALDSIRNLPFKVDVRVCGFKDSSLLPIDIDLSEIGEPQHIVYASIERMFDSLEGYGYFLNIEDDILISASVVESVIAFSCESQINEVFLPIPMPITKS